MSLRLIATRLFHSRRYYCDKLWAACSIRWNGDMEPCACACGNVPVYRLPDAPFLEAWNSPPYRASRAYLLRQLDRDARSEAARSGESEVFDICRNCAVPLVDRHSIIRWRLKGMGLSLRGRILQAPTTSARRMLQSKAGNYAALIRSLRDPGDIVTAFPVLGNLDASNLCNLRCPLCKVGNHELDHPRGMMSPDLFSQILEQVGPPLIRLELYRYGEPLLNPHIVEMIRLASSQYHIQTTISSNLSMPLAAETAQGLVRAGLDTLVVAADGADQATYEKYRQGGSLAMVLENLSAIVSVRKALRSRTPKIIWQYLVFAHNDQTIGAARQLAADRGVDRFIAIEPTVPRYDAHAHWVSPKRGYRGLKDDALQTQVVACTVAPSGAVQHSVPYALTVRVRNTTSEIWRKENGTGAAIRLGIKLYDTQGHFLHEAGRGLLTADLHPGKETEIRAQLTAPSLPGTYRLKLDMVREGEYWFEWKTGHRSKPLWIYLEVV